MKRIFSAGLLQFTPVWGNIEATLEKAQKLIPHAISVDLIVLPEMFSTGYTTDVRHADREGISTRWMEELARHYGCYVCGSVLIKEQRNYYNRFYMYGPDGLVGYYDKRHLFTYMGENKKIIAGRERKVLKIKPAGVEITIMPAVCYDLRFGPWLFNDLGYDVLVVVAAWPHERIKAWENLLKARAIENQCFVIGVNTYGKSPDGIFYGGFSTITTFPSGESLMPPLHGEKFSAAVLDLDYLYSMREEYPFLKDADKFTLKI